MMPGELAGSSTDRKYPSVPYTHRVNDTIETSTAPTCTRLPAWWVPRVRDFLECEMERHQPLRETNGSAKKWYRRPGGPLPDSGMHSEVLAVENVSRCIRTLREERVLLGPDLARLYGVEVRALIQAVQRNRTRFPLDFMFQLDAVEWKNLKSQFVISSWGGSRALPYAFTEQGVAMLSSVLRSQRAIAVNVEIMRAFVRMRRMVAEHADLAGRLDRLEREYDGKFKVIFDAIRQLMLPPATPPRERIGFHRKGALP